MAIIQYPGTNFHDLNLDWMLQQVKNLLTEWGETRTDWDNLLADNTEFKATLENEWDSFHDYILAHIDEDVPAEVVAEINRMAENGELLALITEDTGEGSALSDVVGQWLSTHLTPETEVVIDDSLTIQGAAADAKTAGDAISELKGALNVIEEKMLSFVETKSQSNSYYIDNLTPLNTDKIYAFKVIVNTSGTYTMHIGTAGSMGSMVDTLVDNGAFVANTPYFIFGYTPTVSGIDTIRLSSDSVDWDVDVYELVNIDASNTLKFVDDRAIYVGSEESLTVSSLGDGWANNGDGSYTHTSGTNELEFGVTLSTSGYYLLSFDVDYTSGEFVNVATDRRYQYQCYNGTNHIEVVLKGSLTNKLYFIPQNVNFTISNISFRQINSTGTEVELNLESVLLNPNGNNYGFWNMFISPSSAENATNSTRSVAIGKNSLHALLSGHRNVGIGTFALASMTSGQENVSIGSDSAYQVQLADRNVFIGMGAGSYGTALQDNVVIGHYAMQSAGNGDKNILRNVVIGANAGIHNYKGDNVFIGYQAGYRNQSGEYNVIIGSSSLWGDHGNYNTLVGSRISNNVTTGIEKSIGLGDVAVPTKSNQMMLGSADISEVVMCGNKKINFNNDGTVTWETV